MNINEILAVLWHRKLTLVVVLAVFVAGAFGALKLLHPKYEATSTLALSPKNLTNDLAFFQTIDTIMPIYAEAAQTDQTESIARSRLGGRLESISVRTFTGAPILKIVARGRNKALVQESASAVTRALKERVASGEVGVPSLKLDEIDKPHYPTSPVFPRRKLTIAVAALLGLAFGIAAALLRETFANKVRSRDEVAAAAGVPVYAEIPRERALAKTLPPGQFVSNPSLRSVTEALRDLRTNLLFPAGNISSVAVTSPEGSHGKTTVALGLAVTMARAGTSTILVDADLRKGRLAEVIGIDRAPGLHDVLEGARLESAIRSTGVPHLDVMTGGRLAADPGELLSARFADVVRRLEEEYELIVIDTTPLVPVNDARVVARAAETTLLVVRAGSTSRNAIRTAVERLALIDRGPTAVVLNKSRSKQAKGYYGRPQKRDDRGASSPPKVGERV
jgi:capsular exopolysaccharide synthesis family protein